MDKLTVILLYTHIYFFHLFLLLLDFFPCTVPVRFVKSLMARRVAIERGRGRRGAGRRTDRGTARLFERESKNSFALAFPLLLLNGRRPCNFYTVVKVLFDMWQVASGQQQQQQSSSYRADTVICHSIGYERPHTHIRTHTRVYRTVCGNVWLELKVKGSPNVLLAAGHNSLIAVIPLNRPP